MSIKNSKNGVTLTILVVTIIVMLILFGITFTTATDLLKNSQKNKMKTMLYMVQSRGEALLDDFVFNNDDGSGGVVASSLTDETKLSELGGTASNESDLSGVGYVSGTNYIYRTWTEATLLSQGIDTKNLAEGDTIIVQYDMVNQEVDVASQKGFNEEGVGLHSLKDFEK